MTKDYCVKGHTTNAEVLMEHELTPFVEEFEEVDKILKDITPLKQGDAYLTFGLIFMLGYIKGKQEERARKKATKGRNFNSLECCHQNKLHG